MMVKNKRIGLEGGKELILIVSVLLLTTLFSAYFVNADPQGATAQGSILVDGGPNNTAASRSDPGGVIVTANFNLEQQNERWKAYVGNVSGKFVLQSASNYSIYEWTLPTVTGEIYIARNSSPAWTALSCAVDGVVLGEDTSLGLNSSTGYSINGTFNSTGHTSFVVAGQTMSSCPSTALWLNDTAQVQASSAIWQEVLLNDSGSNLIYASLLRSDASGYNNGSTYDFQAIVADNFTSGVTTYYFFVELG